VATGDVKKGGSARREEETGVSKGTLQMTDQRLQTLFRKDDRKEGHHLSSGEANGSPAGIRGFTDDGGILCRKK